MTSFPFLMAAVADSPGVYYAYLHSDGVGKAIVILLIIGSILTWTVMLYKVTEIFRAKSLSNRFGMLFGEHGEKNLLAGALIREAEHNPGPVAAIYSAGVEKMLDFFADDPANAGRVGRNGLPEPCKLSEAQCNAIEAVLEREVSSQIKELEAKIGLLATLVSLSPFCGLFGTVWGVMMAFCGIAAAGKSDFTALAPGVAGALLTTVAGLIVAIPSLIGYNFLTGTIRYITVQMDNFTEQFMVSVKLQQLQFSKRPAAPPVVPAAPVAPVAPVPPAPQNNGDLL